MEVVVEELTVPVQAAVEKLPGRFLEHEGHLLSFVKRHRRLLSCLLCLVFDP